VGVDHSVFACYGVPIAVDRIRIKNCDDLDDVLSGPLGFVEWGSRCYGGDGGYLVTWKDTYRGGDVADAPEMLPAVPDDESVLFLAETQRQSAASEGAFTIDGAPGWYVAGRVS
jgi:hypothetical protein